MIRKATAADIDSVEQSYLQLLDHEALHGGHTNWVRDVYPTRATAEGALSEGTLFVLEEDGAVRGSMILNQTQLPEYAGIDWAYPAQQVLVIHTLCIPPAQAGRGYGRAMVRFALEEAARQGCQALRLDTSSITGVLSRLEKKGLIDRVYNQEDRRSVSIHLRDEGNALWAQVDRVIDAANAKITQGLDQEHYEQFLSALAIIEGNTVDNNP